jgi:hypothetical protein
LVFLYLIAPNARQSFGSIAVGLIMSQQEGIVLIGQKMKTLSRCKISAAFFISINLL